MLAAIIANLQNEDQPAKLPMVNIDRGGGGGSLWPSYDVADIMTATQLFPEVAGEDGFIRAVRRLKWIGEALPRIKEARERRDAGVFLTAAQLGYAAGYEAGATDHRVPEAAATVQVSEAPAMPPTPQLLDPVVEFKVAAKRAAEAREIRRPDRARGEGGAGIGVALALAALVIGGTALVSRAARH